MINVEFKSKREEHIAYKLIFILLGLFFIIPGIIKLSYKDHLGFDTDFFITTFNILVGIVSLLHGLNIINVSVRKVVRIDNSNLYFNRSSFRKIDSLLWSEIESIELNENKLIANLKSRNTREIELGWIPSEELIAIKNEIQKLAKEKNIDCK